MRTFRQTLFAPAARKPWCLLGIILLLGWDQGRSGTQEQDVAAFEKRLNKLNQEIRDLREKVREEEKKESTIISRLANISLSEKLIRNEISLLNVQLEKTRRELSFFQKQVALQRKKLEKERRSVEMTVVALYKFGRLDFLQFLLRAESVNVLFAESRHLNFLARHQQDIISAYVQKLGELRAATEALEAKEADLSRLGREAGLKREELEAQERENKALIRQITQNKKNYEQALTEMNERARQLQALMTKIVNQEIVLPFPFVPFYEKKGKLPWPMPGRVITRFGLQKHPQFSTSTLNNGIEIAPQTADRSVKSIHAGKVVYADFFQGYGDMVIIDHGLNYYSLYGHLSDYLVGKGDVVRAEQPIAAAGDSGSLKGVCLYLEIRFKTKALDPLQWLRRR